MQCNNVYMHEDATTEQPVVDAGPLTDAEIAELQRIGDWEAENLHKFLPKERTKGVATIKDLEGNVLEMVAGCALRDHGHSVTVECQRYSGNLKNHIGKQVVVSMGRYSFQSLLREQVLYGFLYLSSVDPSLSF